MKISYRTHPILTKLFSGHLGKVNIAPEDSGIVSDIQEAISESWKHNCPRFYAQNIQFLTAPLCEAITNAWGKLSDPDLLREVLEGCHGGTFIRNNNASCYFIERTIKGDYAFTLFEFSIDGNGELFFAGFCSHVYSPEFAPSMYGTSLIEYPKGLWHHFESNLITIITVINFLKYADVEVKYLSPNKRLKDISCKYINETRLPIKIINSTWFTTLVKSDSFKVRGHFRLQPKKKDGAWTKELIWINEFEKSGYTAPARKLSDTHVPRNTL